VQVEEVEEVVVVEVEVLVGSSSGPPTQSPQVPPTQSWWGMVDLGLGQHLTPQYLQHLVATHPLALTQPWWPSVGEQARASTHHRPHSVGVLVEEAHSLRWGLAGWAHQAKVRLADCRRV
jgi:hypothetical protein